MCEICGKQDGCWYTNKPMGTEQILTADDWREIHEHITKTHLPFLHGIIRKARLRRLLNRGENYGHLLSHHDGSKNA